MPKGNRALFVGRSGQLAAVAELLFRGYNVAIPEVDEGEDIFVIRDDTDGYWPIQVKTGTAIEQENDVCFTQFNIPRSQLVNETTPDLWYVFILRRNNSWNKFLIIPRKDLAAFYEDGKLGNQTGDNLGFRFSFRPDSIRCSESEFQSYESNWSAWPDLFR